MKQLDNKIILVTGGTAGMGRTTAAFLADQGANVIICGRNAEQGQRTVEELKDAGQRVRFMRCDVAREEDSSVAGVMAIPGQAAYVASKFAICGLTQAAAIEYAQAAGGAAVRVNAIAPGPISGGMNDAASLAAHPERTQRKIGATAMRRFGQPEEVASTVAWLLSDAASYITGVIVPIDGGATAGKF